MLDASSRDPDAGRGSCCEEVVWRVRPLASPQVLRHCARCAATRAFVSTDKLRCNAQQRRLDVWLLYACAVCERTWQRAVLDRVAPEEIGADLLGRIQRNDPEVAWQLACAPDPRLRVVACAEVVVERPPPPAEPYAVRLAVPWPCDLRLDRLLARELGCTRAALVRRVQRGEIRLVPPGQPRALAHPPRDGARLVIGRAASAGTGAGTGAGAGEP